MNTMPLIKIEIEGMRQTLVHALNERMLNFDAYVTHAVDQFCAEDRIKDIINKAAAESISRAVDSEVKDFSHSVRVVVWLSKLY